MFRVTWLGEVSIDADGALAALAKQGRETANKVDRCGEWLQAFLSERACPSEEIFQAAKTAGFSKDNCYRAKAKLNGKVRASSTGFQGGWVWGLGEQTTWGVRPKARHADDDVMTF